MKVWEQQHGVRSVQSRDLANIVTSRDNAFANTVNILERSPGTARLASSAVIGCSLSCVRINKLFRSSLPLVAMSPSTYDRFFRSSRAL